MAFYLVELHAFNTGSGTTTNRRGRVESSTISGVLSKVIQRFPDLNLVDQFRITVDLDTREEF